MEIILALFSTVGTLQFNNYRFWAFDIIAFSSVFQKYQTCWFMTRLNMSFTEWMKSRGMSYNDYIYDEKSTYSHFRITFPVSYLFLQFCYWTYYFYIAQDNV